MPVLSTNTRRVPVKTLRWGSRLRPPFGRGGSGGSHGPITAHRSSLTSSFAMPPLYPSAAPSCLALLASGVGQVKRESGSRFPCEIRSLIPHNLPASADQFHRTRAASIHRAGQPRICVPGCGFHLLPGDGLQRHFDPPDPGILRAVYRAQAQIHKTVLRCAVRECSRKVWWTTCRRWFSPYLAAKYC